MNACQQVIVIKKRGKEKEEIENKGHLRGYKKEKGNNRRYIRFAVKPQNRG